MKKYEYVQIHIGRMDGSKSGEIRQTINDYAAKGFAMPDLCLCAKMTVEE